jgi:hypothetical protein
MSHTKERKRIFGKNHKNSVKTKKLIDKNEAIIKKNKEAYEEWQKKL